MIMMTILILMTRTSAAAKDNDASVAKRDSDDITHNTNNTNNNNGNTTHSDARQGAIGATFLPASSARCLRCLQGAGRVPAGEEGAPSQERPGR